MDQAFEKLSTSQNLPSAYSWGLHPNPTCFYDDEDLTYEVSPKVEDYSAISNIAQRVKILCQN